MSKAIEIKTEDFNPKVVENKRVSIVDFWAPWCGYCVRMMPIFEKLSNEMSEQLDFFKVNTDEEVKLAQALNIEILPTFAIIKDGKVVDRKIGFVPEDELKAAIEAVL